MKIEYKVLWLDDAMKDFKDEEIVSEIEEHLKENGFRPRIDAVENFDEFNSCLENEADYDLILTDYHMNGVNGDEVVESVRGREIFTEILFYTAQADLVDTKKISRVSFLETKKKGDHYEVLIEETKKLIDLTVKKFQNIVAMRGMIMHETSFLDSEMMKIIDEYSINNKNSDLMSDISIKILNGISEHMAMKKKQLERFKNNNNFNKLKKDNYLFSSDFKIKTIKEIIDKVSSVDFTESYKDDIINNRNKFAHAVLERDENGREYFSFGKTVFDDQLCKDIRKKIIQHTDNIQSLKASIAENA